jgi:hypothetical protein
MSGGNEQRTRPDFSDPASMAYELSELRGLYALLQQQNSGAIQNLTSSVQSMQADLRAIGHRVEEVTRLQVHQEQHGDGLRRAFEAIENLAESTRVSFQQSRDAADEYRVRREADETEWRAAHVKENNETRDKVMRFSGGAVLASMIVGLLLCVMMWYSDKVDAYASKERDRTAQDVNDINQRVRAIESYLAQGGATPDRRTPMK